MQDEDFSERSHQDIIYKGGCRSVVELLAHNPEIVQIIQHIFFHISIISI